MAKKKPETPATVNNITGDTSNPQDNKRRQAAIDNQPLCTVTLSDIAPPVPNVKGKGDDAKVEYNGEEVTLAWYLSNLEDSILVQYNIRIGAACQAFTDYFASHVQFIMELRDRLPARGRGCKIAIIHPDGTTKTYTWSQFCLEFFGISADWVLKQIKMYTMMQDCPGEPEPEAEVEDEGEEEEIHDPSPEAIQQQLEEKKDRAERQTDNLLQELSNLIGLIERHKDAVPEELLNAATAAKKRTLPPIPMLPLADADDLLKEIDAVLPKPAGEVPPSPDNQADMEQFPAPTPRRSKKSKSTAAGE